MANMTFALDALTKKQFVDFCDEVGLSASSVINVCIKTIVRERRIPFIIEAPHIPNAETIAAMEEGDRIVNDPTRKRHTLSEALEELTGNAKRQKMLAAYNEAKAEMQSPTAEFCDDPAKLHDFLFK